MANFNIKNYSEQYEWSWAVLLSDANPQNIIGNAGTTGYIIKGDIWGFNLVSNTVDIDLIMYPGAGTPICSHLGNGAITGVTVSTDAIPGVAALTGPMISLQSKAGLQFIRRFTLNEATSIIAKSYTAGGAGLWINYTVYKA